MQLSRKSIPYISPQRINQKGKGQAAMKIIYGLPLSPNIRVIWEVRTLQNLTWKVKYPQISQSLKKGKEVSDIQVERFSDVTGQDI